MADQAKLVGLRRPELGGLADIRRRHRFGVFAPRAVAAFARLAVEAAFLVGLHGVVRILLKRIEDVLMARLARIGTNVLCRLVIGCGWSGGARLLWSAPGSSGTKYGRH